MILRIFFKYVEIIMKLLDSSKISSITRIEQIALHNSSNNKYIYIFQKEGKNVIPNFRKVACP